MPSAQLGYVVLLIWQHLSTSKGHLQASDINYIKRNVYNLILFRTDILVLQIL